MLPSAQTTKFFQALKRTWTRGLEKNRTERLCVATKLDWAVCEAIASITCLIDYHSTVFRCCHQFLSGQAQDKRFVNKNNNVMECWVKVHRFLISDCNFNRRSFDDQNENHALSNEVEREWRMCLRAHTQCSGTTCKWCQSKVVN